VEPLPYHRTLSSSEHTKLWARLQERWAVREGSYWYPLGSDEDPAPHVVAFQLMWFDYAVSLEKLRAALAEHGVTRVWELREYGPEYEIDVAEMEPMYNAAEGYWTSGDLDWLLNVSHESSITVAGEWLITSVQRLWPDWEQHIYEDWDYTCFRPRRGAADKARGPRRERHAPLPY
ncbi:MAG: hypothetical protein JWO42_1539, partial [Chloroflexi bacterium]|nr:hypothetical protein [Chloroflexota bacterium]